MKFTTATISLLAGYLVLANASESQDIVETRMKLYFQDQCTKSGLSGGEYTKYQTFTCSNGKETAKLTSIYPTYARDIYPEYVNVCLINTDTGKDSCTLYHFEENEDVDKVLDMAFPISSTGTDGGRQLDRAKNDIVALLDTIYGSDNCHHDETEHFKRVLCSNKHSVTYLKSVRADGDTETIPIFMQVCDADGKDCVEFNLETDDLSDEDVKLVIAKYN